MGYLSMLSDTTYSTDFLNSRIINVDASSRKRKWSAGDTSVMHYQTKSNDLCVEENGSSVVDASFATEFPDHLSYIECGRSIAYSYEAGIPGFMSRDECSIYASASNSQNIHPDSKCNLGNREELSTPVMITPLDTSTIMDNSNYLYGSMNEAPTSLTATNCFTFALTDSPCGQLSNGMPDTLDPLSSVTSNRFDFGHSTESSHPYVLQTQSASPIHTGVGEPPLGSLTSPTPCTPLFWFDDPGQSSTEADYDTPNCVAETFHSAHLEISQSDQCATPNTDKTTREMFDDVYRVCEVKNENIEMDSVHYQQDTSMDAVLSSSALSGDSSETRRDKLTGKFKQNVNEHSSTSEKLCKVCSDRAVNHNFGQLTCESCKAFFRRNAHKFLPSLLDPTRSFTTPTGIDYTKSLMSPSQLNYPTELTCTLKTGEHEITPTTRRECPACRLKKCFRVGMRPDLIQVRKKDGSKPRWLEKVPSAAIVHEKHLQSTDNNCWTSLTSTKSKSDSGGERLVKQYFTKDCREEVCSTDSGSCISNETTSLPLDTSSSIFETKQTKGKGSESNDLMDLGKINEIRLTDSMLDLTGPSAASGAALVDVTQATAEFYQSADGLPSNNQLITTATVNALNGPTVLVQSTAAVSVPTITTGLQPAQTIGYEMPRNADQSLSYQLNAACTPFTNKMEHLNGFEDFILLTNTPRFLVPTNVVTIATAPSTNQSSLSSSSLTHGSQTFGINLNGVDFGQHQSLGSQLHYTTYTKLSPDQSVQSISPTSLLIESAHSGVTQPLLTPIWSSTSNSSLTSGIIQMATTTKPSAQTLVPTMPKCVLATSIQPIQSIAQTALVDTQHNVSTTQFKPLTVNGATSFRLSVQSVPASLGTVALAAVLPAATPLPTQMIHRTTTIPTNSSLLLPTVAESGNTLPSCTVSTSPALSFVFTDASPPKPLNSSTSSHIVIVPHSTTWSTTTNTTINTNNGTQFAQSQTELLKNENQFSMSVPVTENVKVSKIQWSTELDIGKASQRNTVEPNPRANSCSNVPMYDSTDILAGRCNLEHVNSAWTAMWRDGEFPNPDDIELNIDTNTHSSLLWRLDLANMWDDIFVRRIAVFAVALFGPLCNRSIEEELSGTDAISALHSSESTWPQEPSFSTSIGSAISSTQIDESRPVDSKQFLTWHDLLWLAKYRFADCVPVLLISCLIRHDKPVGSEIGSYPAVMSPSKISVIQTANQPMIQLTDRDSELNTSNDSSISWLLNQPPNRDNPCCDGSIKPSPITTEVESNSLSSFARSTETGTHTAIRFRCTPGGSVLLSLTNLSRSLAQLTVNAVRPGCEDDSKQMAYPILQYLDAYIAQFGNFLAHQPKLLGAFLALKLTDPHFEEQINSTTKANSLSNQKVHIASDAERTHRLTQLHKYFVKIFSDAADSVALSTACQSGARTNDNCNGFGCMLEIDAQEVAAANSRRAMLQEFLTWSRRFDTAWHEFQFDTWLQAVNDHHCDLANTKSVCISRGLNALLNDSLDSTANRIEKSVEELGAIRNLDKGSHGLYRLLLDAKCELNTCHFATQ